MEKDSLEPQVVGRQEDLPVEELDDENGLLNQAEVGQEGVKEGVRKVDPAKDPEAGKGADKDEEENTVLLDFPQEEEPKQISARAAATNLITCMIGASVLSLPHVVSRCGWILGPLLLALAGLVSCRGCLLVNQAIDATFELNGLRPKNIGDVAEVCFGLRGRAAIINLSCVFQVCKCGVYLLVIGTNLHYWDSDISRRQCTLLATIVCLRLVFLRDITVISRWSIIGVVASVFYLVTITCGGLYAAKTLAGDERPRGLWPVRSTELPALFAVMLYTYSPADVLPVLKHDMSDPKELPRALWIAHTVVVVIYIGLASAGFYGWGRQVEGNVLESMCDLPGCPGTIPRTWTPGSKWYLGYILSIAVVSNLMVTIPVVMYCVFKVLEAQYSSLQASRLVNCGMRISSLCAAVSLAVFVPFFVQVLAVVSTALLISLQVFLPVAMIAALGRKGAAVKCGFPEVCLLLLGICVFFVGMASALRNLKEAIDLSGEV